MIKQCLKAAGIKNVVWVDDHFAKPTREELIEKLVKAAHKLKQNGLQQIEAVPSLKLAESESSIANQIGELSEELTESELITLSEKIWEAIRENQEEAPENDLSDQEFQSLISAFGNRLTTWSLRDWTSEGVETCSSYTDDTLFLVDKEFTRESPTFDGSEIVSEVVKRSNAFCIFLTHRCKTGQDEVNTREEVAETKGIQFYKFAVLSKHPGERTEDISKRFARALSTVMMQRFTGDLAHKIADTIKKEADATATALSKVSVLDLDRAIFVNSASEGVLEYDVIVRVFHVLQSTALNDALIEPDLQVKLRAIRLFTKSTRGFDVHSAPNTPLAQFRKWRRSEVFQDGEGLNAMHAPLVCGDVFQYIGDSEHRFVLLGQACDLMIRPKGTRKAGLGFLLGMQELNPSTDGMPKTQSPYRRFELGKIFSQDSTCHVDFQDLLVADLDVLDLAVLNADGLVSIRKEHASPKIALTEGWEKRMEKLKKRFGVKNGILVETPLSVGSSSTKYQCVLTPDSLKYPLKRIGRLNANTATALLAAWATFETRAALQHDFSVSDNSSESADDCNTAAENS